MPTAEEKREIAAHLNLSAEQSALLWRRVEVMCRHFMEYRRSTPLPGPERRALLKEARQLSRRLTAVEMSIAELSPHLAYNIRRLVGPVLAEALSESAFWGPSHSFPIDQYSIHDLDLLECWFDPDTNEHQGVGAPPPTSSCSGWKLISFIGDRMRQRMSRFRFSSQC